MLNCLILPNFQAVLGGQVHAVALFGAVGLVEFLKLYHDSICAQVGERMGILLDGVGLRLQSRQRAPVGGESAEEAVIIEVLIIGRNASMHLTPVRSAMASVSIMAPLMG